MAARKRLRMGVIGLGVAGRFHCEALRDHVRDAVLTAGVEANPTLAGTVAAEFGIPVYGSVPDLLAAGDCDAVAVATPHTSHADVAEACLNAGRPVLVEKPLAVSVSEADGMIRLARRKRLPLACVLQLRQQPHVARALELCRSGELGEIRHVMLTLTDFRTQAYYDSNAWRGTWKGEGGGVLLNQAPHWLDILVQVAGLPKRVTGRIATRLHRMEVEDQAEGMLEFANGAGGYVYCSTNEPYSGTRLDVVGNRGRLTLRPGRLDGWRIAPDIATLAAEGVGMWDRPAETPIRWRCRRRTAGGHAAVIRNFARHVLHGEPLEGSAESAMGALELANAMVLSHFTGRPVDFPLSRGAYDRQLDTLRTRSRFRRRPVRLQQQVDPRMRN